MEDLIKKLQQFKENDPEKFNTFKSNFNKVFGQISGNWPQQRTPIHNFANPWGNPESANDEDDNSVTQPILQPEHVQIREDIIPNHPGQFPGDMLLREVNARQLLTDRIATAPFDPNTHTIMHNGTSNKAYVFHYSPNAGERTLHAWDLPSNELRPSALQPLFQDRPSLAIGLLQRSHHGNHRQIVREGHRYFNVPEGEIR